MTYQKFLLIFSTLIAFSGYSQNVEYYFKFIEPNRNKINTIVTQTISIDNVKGDTVYAYANQQEFDALLKLGYEVEILPHPSELNAKAVVMATTVAGMATWDRYPTYEVYRAMMKKFEADYPTLCKLDSIGTTVQGRKLYVLKISDNVESDEPKPEVFYTSTMHGDETAGFILLLRLADYLLSNYNTLPQVKELVDNLQIYINPNANPDGTYYGSNSTVVYARRYNANSVDLNRNFPDPRAGQHPDNNQWQPETQAMMDFAAQHNFVLSANFHGGAEVVNYPWDTWTSSQVKHPDNDWYIGISRAYVDTVHKYSPSTYMSGFNNGITNGGDWYVITGGRQDYMNYFHRCREVTIEVSNTKLLGSELLPTLWDYNRASLINYLKNALYGFGGTVKNTSNEPLHAEIVVCNHDRFNSSVKTNPANGQFFRMIEPGTYRVAALANGYKPSIKSVTIAANEFVPLNFTLEPEGLTPVMESFEQALPERFNFTYGNWVRTNLAANSGTYSLRSPAIGDSQSTTCALDVDIREAGIFSFYFKVSSEAKYDFFKFYIDDKLQGLWSGYVNWTKFTTILDKGAHQLRWMYVKDGSGNAGSDCVYIDDIVLPKCNGQLALTTTINSAAYDNLKIVLGDSTKTTGTNGMVAFQKYPLDTIVNLKVYSENNLIGSGVVELKWQQVNYSSNFDAHFSATFEVKTLEKPVEAATISFNNEQKQTDQNGISVFSNVPFGLSHPFTISKDGYYTYSGELRITSDTIYRISIYPTYSPINEANNPITIFPNPAENNFTINLNDFKGNVSISLVDLTGKPVARLYNENVIEESFNIVINRDEIDIPPGIYFLVTRNGSKTLTDKIIFTKP
ncbi:MAG TPA: T9SS type A sorting domain-containing protein [Bacteroidales bacterium]|nr:T9SS type A sorting domain-containing protein [Bacteroidales bacterium]